MLPGGCRGRRRPREIEYCPRLLSPHGDATTAQQVYQLRGGADAAASDEEVDEPDFDEQYLGPLARGSAGKTAPVRLHELVVLARTSFSREKVELLVGMVQDGEWPPNDMSPMQRYWLKIGVVHV